MLKVQKKFYSRGKSQCWIWNAEIGPLRALEDVQRTCSALSSTQYVLIGRETNALPEVNMFTCSRDLLVA